jgi:hypothetical protein
MSAPADKKTRSHHARMWRAYRQIDHNEEGHVVPREDAEDSEALQVPSFETCQVKACAYASCPCPCLSETAQLVVP